VRIRRRLGAAALLVAVLAGGLLVMTAGPPAACSCAMVRSEAERMARADAVFVGELVGSRVDPSASPRETRRIPYPAPVLLTFEVSRVYKGAVGARQEIVTPGGGGASCGGFGIGLRGAGPFLVFAFNSAGDMYRLAPGQYASNLCSGSRALTDSGTPASSGPPPTGGPGRLDNSPSPTSAPPALADNPAAAPSGSSATGTSRRWDDSPSAASLTIGLGLLAAVVAAGLTILRTHVVPGLTSQSTDGEAGLLTP
jgi:hypothetical protein